MNNDFQIPDMPSIPNPVNPPHPNKNIHNMVSLLGCFPYETLVSFVDYMIERQSIVADHLYMILADRLDKKDKKSVDN